MRLTYSVAPVVRVVVLLVFAAMLARGGWKDLLLGAILLSGTCLLVGLDRCSGFGTMLRRVRWLLFFLLVVYGWFTPGPQLFPWLGFLSPTEAGIAAGAVRAGALLLMVTATHVLLQTTARGALVSALTALGRVARPLGLDSERLAVRMMLTLEAIPATQAMVSESVSKARASGRLHPGEVAASVYQRLVQLPPTADSRPVSIPDTRSFSPLQWMLPTAIVALFLLAG